jgi:hypothetical protein
VEGRLHTAKQFNKFSEARIAAGIASPAYGDPFNISPFCLEVCKNFIRDGFKILKSAVLFLDPACAVIASFLEWQAIPASQRLDTLDVFEITIFAEPAAVYTGASSDVNGQVSHFLVLLSPFFIV